MSTNSNQSTPSSEKVSEKFVKVSEKPLKGFGKGTEKIVKNGNVSEIIVSEKVSETKKLVESKPNVSTKPVSEKVPETKKVSEKPIVETSKVSTKKKKMVPKQLANLQRGGKVSKKVVEKVPETIVETPKTSFTFPVKAIIIMAFIAGGTLGFLGLWNWWKNNKKSQEPQIDDVVPQDFPQQFSQEELDLIAQYEANNQ